MTVSNRDLNFQGASIFRFHVCFGEVYCKDVSKHAASLIQIMTLRNAIAKAANFSIANETTFPPSTFEGDLLFCGIREGILEVSGAFIPGVIYGQMSMYLRTLPEN